MLSLGTFGTRKAGDILGADAIVTLDQSFINNYEVRVDTLQERLRTMTVNLLPPFCNVVLPVLMQPTEALSLFR